MSSVVDHLNELLCRERGEVQAVRELIAEIRCSDPDIAESARDALETAAWSCHGLYHRIVHLNGTPTLESADLVGALEEQPDTRSKIELVCREQQRDRDLVSHLVGDRKLDADTKAFLEDLLQAHQATQAWCETMLAQWRVER